MWRKIIVGAVVLFFIVLTYSVISFASQGRPQNWDYSFNEYATGPFSTRIFFKELPNFFPKKSVTKLDQDEIYNVFWSNPSIDALKGDSLLSSEPGASFSDEDYSNKNNYVSVSYTFESNLDGVDGLINHVYQGGHVQIHAFNFNYELLERLEIEIGVINGSANATPNLATQKVIWKGDSFDLRQTRTEEYFLKYPSLIDTLVINDSGRVMGIKAKIGHGSISLFTMPHIFTNYDLLYEDRGFAETVISDLPIEDTYWSKDLNQYQKKERGLLYFIFSHSALKWGYFILLFSVLAFFLLNLQRKQKAIPLLSTPKNLSLSFLQTISDLHFAQLDYHSILRKKMNFLKSKIKTDYHLLQKEVDDGYIQQLAKRSKIHEESIQRLFKLYNETIRRKAITKAEFESLCHLFQLFKK